MAINPAPLTYSEYRDLGHSVPAATFAVVQDRLGVSPWVWLAVAFALGFLAHAWIF